MCEIFCWLHRFYSEIQRKCLKSFVGWYTQVDRFTKNGILLQTTIRPLKDKSDTLSLWYRLYIFIYKIDFDILVEVNNGTNMIICWFCTSLIVL